ncbi:MAG TPA: efflux RND transporter periplasmic adaptor subunit [Syntrophorhabdaceae bacterium]|nr:efflux RND transporter periplasmic adaptor subunit [Syntrophorhabdaceae bacterium]HQM80352.1 efflux RND transporter periplasmic adaptor subunit [Syntrophorhabdaceae bacterium]
MHINKKTRFIACFIILCAGLVPAGCNQKQPPPQNTPEVAFFTIQPERVALTTELPGRVSAYYVAEVRPQVNGIIQKRFFEEGADVKAGDILYQIDPAPYQAAYDNAKAALARAEANVPPIQLRAERYKELVSVKAVSQQEYDDIKATLKQLEAEVDTGKAAVEAARINLAYCSIKAPITGRIGRSHATVGALVTAHQPAPLAVIQQIDPIYVDATQTSANLLRLRKNIASGRIKQDGPEQTKVKLLLEDGTVYPEEGRLKFSDVTVDSSTGSFILRMVFPNKKHTLLPGMYARAVVQEGIADNAILVPHQGVSRDPKGNPVVLIVDAENKVQQRMIAIVERAIGDKWFVTSGLAPGDRVIVEGVQRVRPGASVKAVPFDGGQTAKPSVKTVQPPAKAN